MMALLAKTSRTVMALTANNSDNDHSNDGNSIDKHDIMALMA